MKPCDLCGTKHEAWKAHVFASNAASNKASASNRSASNNASNRNVREVRGGDEGARKELVVGVPGALAGVGIVADERSEGLAQEAGHSKVDAPKKQRWPRDSYNAYQREYMRKRRLKVLDAVGVDQVELGLCRT